VQEECSEMVLPGFHSRIVMSITLVVSAVEQMSRMKSWASQKLNIDATFWAPTDSFSLLVSPYRSTTV